MADPVLAFEATKPEQIAETEKESSNFAVFVIPSGETETRINRGDLCEEHRMVSVIVTGPVGQVTRATAQSFVQQLKRSLRLTNFDGYRWRNNESIVYWDPDALK